MRLMDRLSALFPESLKPLAWRTWIETTRLRSRIAGKGRRERYRCPCCGTVAPFRDGGFRSDPSRYASERYENQRQDVLCPACFSMPRHRILAHWCAENLRLMQESEILYFAREPCMAYWMRKNGVSCVTADLYQHADLQIDIERTGLPDGSYDLIFCNHVLEHVSDFRRALAELYRILRPAGTLVLSFPTDPRVDAVDEAPPGITPEERLRRFGQHDHNRVFGPGAVRFLKDAGFEVTTFTGDECPADILPVVGPADYDDNVLYVCRKPFPADEPLVSVIVPVYNVLPFIDECMESLTGQNWGNLEIVLIDDGSSDGSGEACARWAERDSRVRLIRQENRGLSGARNTGLRECTGDYVCFVDPDDCVRRDMVRRLTEALLSSGADAAIGRHTFLRNDGKRVPAPALAPGEYTGEEVMRELLRGLPHPIWGKMYRRQVWDEVRFPAGRVYEDMVTLICVLTFCRRCVSIGDDLYTYRSYRPGGITRDLSRKNCQDILWSWAESERIAVSHAPSLESDAVACREFGRIAAYLRMAQPDSDCPPEELAALRGEILAHAKDAPPFSLRREVLEQRAALFLIRFAPRLAARAFRLARKGDMF